MITAFADTSAWMRAQSSESANRSSIDMRARATVLGPAHSCRCSGPGRSSSSASVISSEPGVSCARVAFEVDVPLADHGSKLRRRGIPRVVHDEVLVDLLVGVDGVVDESLAGRPAPRRLGLVVLASRQEERSPPPVAAPVEPARGVDQSFDLHLVAVEQEADHRVEVVELRVGGDDRARPRRRGGHDAPPALAASSSASGSLPMIARAGPRDEIVCHGALPTVHVVVARRDDTSWGSRTRVICDVLSTPRL